jgi:pimeloyl-ACP methyl ester carboxylesterase
MPVFQSNGHSIYYEDTGNGDPLVLVCGLSADLQVWRFQVGEIRQTHRVIVFDNRGAGRSSAPDEPYTIPQMAADLRGLLDHLRLPRVHLLGWSMGGVIAQSFALANPARVRQLLLLGTYIAPDAYLREAISNWVNVRRSNMPYGQIVRYVARMVFSPDLARNTEAYEGFIQTMLANPYRQTDHGFFRQAAANLAYEAPSKLRDLRMPAAVLVGQHDQLTPRYMSEELAAALPHASLRILPGAHSGFLEYPNDYNQAVVGILRGGG